MLGLREARFCLGKRARSHDWDPQSGQREQALFKEQPIRRRSGEHAVAGIERRVQQRSPSCNACPRQKVHPIPRRLAARNPYEPDRGSQHTYLVRSFSCVPCGAILRCPNVNTDQAQAHRKRAPCQNDPSHCSRANARSRCARNDRRQHRPRLRCVGGGSTAVPWRLLCFPFLRDLNLGEVSSPVVLRSPSQRLRLPGVIPSTVLSNDPTNPLGGLTFTYLLQDDMATRRHRSVAHR